MEEWSGSCYQKNETVAHNKAAQGTVAKMITSVSGSSAYFEGSIISYSNLIKINIFTLMKIC